MEASLILRLEGVLQSWGTRSRWDKRDSGSFPSKSGVIGLLACALGYPRGDKRLSDLQEKIVIGVRADRPGRTFWDYQTVTAMKTQAKDGRVRQSLFAADGEIRVGGPTLVTPREYLQDACFTVVLRGETSILAQCEQALENPVWQTFLGRKCCPPSRPVLEGITDKYGTLEEALESYPLCPRPAEGSSFLCEIEDRNGAFIRQDVVLISGTSYAKRRIRIESISFGGMSGCI